MRAAFYLRVSTDDQDVANQERALREYAQKKGYEVVGIFADEGISGAMKEMERNSFNAMMKSAARRDFDVLLVFALDRLTRRGIGPAFSILNDLKERGVAWESLSEPWLSDSGPGGEIVLAIVAWVSEQERRRISERTRAARKQREALGLSWGRPKGRKDKRKRTRRWQKKPQTGWRPPTQSSTSNASAPVAADPAPDAKRGAPPDDAGDVSR